MPGETPQQRKERLAERARVDSSLRESSKVVRTKRPATKKQLTARAKVVAADVKRTAAANAAGKSARLRAATGVPSLPGLSALQDVLTPKKKPRR